MDRSTADGYATASCYGRPGDPERQRTPEQPAFPGPRPSRRGVLVGAGLAVAAAAAAGAVFGSAGGPPAPAAARRASQELADAAAAERELIAALDAALGPARGNRRTALRLVRQDHVAHLRALDAAIAEALGAAPSPSRSAAAAPVPPPAPSVAAVRAAEGRAAGAAAARAMRLSGRDAALLASISAAEASHAELLT